MDDAQTDSKHLVSIIVPIFNGERFLKSCLESLLAQSYQDIELICIDDGSSDETPAILAQLAEEDSRMRVITQANAGPAKARNAGLAAARGEYLYFFDADDTCEPTLVESLVKRLEQTQADIVVTSYQVLDERVGKAFRADWAVLWDKYGADGFTWHDNPDWIFRACQNLPWNKLFRADFVREHKLAFQEDVFLTEDLMFSAPALVKAGRIAFMEDYPIYHREGFGTNVMANKDAHPTDFIEAFCTLREWLEAQGLYDELRVAYENWALDGVIYNIKTLNSYEGFTTARTALVEGGGLERMGIADIDPSELHEERFGQFLADIQGNSDECLYKLYVTAREDNEEKTSRLFSEWRINGEKQAWIEDMLGQLDERDEHIHSLEALRDELYAQRDQARRELEETKASLAQAQEERSDLEDRLTEARAQIQAIQEELLQTQAEKRSVQDELAATQKHFDEIMGAAEQKVGQVICWVPRQVQKAVLKNKAD